MEIVLIIVKFILESSKVIAPDGIGAGCMETAIYSLRRGLLADSLYLLYTSLPLANSYLS